MLLPLRRSSLIRSSFIALSVMAFVHCGTNRNTPSASGGTAGTLATSGGSAHTAESGGATSGGSSTATAGTTANGSGGASAQSGAAGAAGARGGSVGSASGGSVNTSGGTAAGGTAGADGSGGTTAGAAGAALGGAGGTTMGGVSPVISGGVRWFGRVDVSDAAAQKFAWSGSGFIATVTGDAISVKLRSDGGSDPIFFQPVIDGKPGTRVSVASSDGVKTVSLGGALGAGDHVVSLYRETEGKPDFAYSTFLGFASGTLKDPPAYSGRLIEIVGDSISAGYGNLGSEQHPNGGADPSGGCHFTTETESAYLTYGAVAARALNADASIIAASGWGIYSDNGGNTTNVLPNVFANTVGGQTSPAWSFAAKPQAVVINLGTNDFSANMSLSESAFSTPYTAFIQTIRGKYPDALILCAIGPLLYGTGLTNATAYINNVVKDVNQKGDAKVKVLNFGQQDSSKGTGCDYHPNVVENQRMADLLVAELEASLKW